MGDAVLNRIKPRLCRSLSLPLSLCLSPFHSPIHFVVYSNQVRCFPPRPVPVLDRLKIEILGIFVFHREELGYRDYFKVIFSWHAFLGSLLLLLLLYSSIIVYYYSIIIYFIIVL